MMDEYKKMNEEHFYLENNETVWEAKENNLFDKAILECNNWQV